MQDEPTNHAPPEFEMMEQAERATAAAIRAARAERDSRLHSIHIALAPDVRDTIVTIDGEQQRDVYRVALMVDADSTSPPVLTVTRRAVPGPDDDPTMPRMDVASYTAGPGVSIEMAGMVALIEEHARASLVPDASKLLHTFMIQLDRADPRASTLYDIVADAERYRALRRTETAAPWRYMLGRAGTLDEFADAMVALSKTVAVSHAADERDAAMVDVATVLMTGAREMAGGV